MTENRFIEPTRAMRFKLVTAGLVGLAIGLGLELWGGPRLTWVAALPPCDALPWIRLELTVGVVICWLVGYVSLKRGVNNWRLDQTPLPDSWVWSRTQVRTGHYAKFSAITKFVFGAVFLLCPVVIAWWLKLYLIFGAAQQLGCA
jgi:hypothetical protein